MKTEFNSVDEYIVSQSASVRTALKRVRNAARNALPDAEETISYKIPLYKLRGLRVIYFAGWKQRYSLYPATVGVLEAFKGEPAPYELSKGTIRFPPSEPVPVRLTQRIAKFRAKEEAERSKRKPAALKRSPSPGRRTA
ncbi:MAG: DUF1801 domain-containing protein [Acidobacteriota bacterium]|nr:DUF1801 domain-containing protein [Acidobacteriota bacterium]